VSQIFSEGTKSFRRCEVMFGDVLAHSGCIRNRGSYCGMSYVCVRVVSELIPRQDPINASNQMGLDTSDTLRRS
jgi:hypothetical protein